MLEKYIGKFIDFSKVLIGFINGPAVGISVSTLGLFDGVYTSSNSTFVVPFIGTAQSAEGCSSFVLPSLMRPIHAKELLLFDRKLIAQEAERSSQISSSHSPIFSLAHTGSIRLNESSTAPLAEHQPNWTVKSTIVTAYTSGAGEFAGPTVVSKVVSEASATSSSDISLKTSIKEVSAKGSNEHFASLFDKVFVAITYTIGLCYLLFLVAIGRSKNTNIIYGNGTTIRNLAPSSSSTANTGNRMKKDIQ